MIGRSVRRLEDLPLLTGRGRFVADLSFPGQLHMRVVRSAVANGRLLSVDVAAARERAGVVAVWTSADLGPIPPIDFRMTGLPELAPYRQPVLAVQRVRYVGEPVAVVLAEDEYLAEDAEELVVVDVDEWTPVLDPCESPAEFDAEHDTAALTLRESYGDLNRAFATAHAVVEVEVRVGRHSGVPLETRGCLARFDAATEVLEMHGAAKVPHQNRDALARMLGLAQHRVVLREGHVGGGFGVRGELYPEDVLVALAALRTGRPVRWVEDRREHLVATNHSRDQVHRLIAAVDSNGIILAFDDEFWHDQGAYVRTHGATVPTLTAAMLPGPYRVPAYRVAGHIRLTNKTPAGTYRAPGRYECTFARERVIDAVAHRLALDPVEVRRRNLIGVEEMPYKRPLRVLATEVVYDSGDYERMLDRLIAHLDLPRLRSELSTRRSAGEAVGLGLGFFVEKSGLGPVDGVRLSVDETGEVEVVTGAASVGQGVETVVAQVCADVLTVDVDQIRVVHGQTDRIAHGMGAFASRVTVMTGNATHRAATAVATLAREVAAELLDAVADDLELAEGGVQVRGAPSRRVTLGTIAAALRPAAALAQGRTPGLAADGWFSSEHMVYPYGLHAAVVRVDRETGGVEILRYVVAYDVGRAINPMLVDGQVVGGVAQGIGGALLEEFRYDDAGQPLATSFMDYLLPTATDVPPVEVLISEDAPSPLNPLGVKGAGEGGTTGCGAAIAAALDDALGSPGAVTRLPATPAEVRRLVLVAAQTAVGVGSRRRSTREPTERRRKELSDAH